MIGELYFGRMFGCMQDRKDHGSYIAALDTLMPPLVAAASFPPYVRPFILGCAIFVPSLRRALAASNRIISAARACVARRSQSLAAGNETRRDLLQQLFEVYRDRGEKLDYGIHDIEQEAWVAL